MADIPLGAPIPDDPTDPAPDPDIDSLSDAEINKAIAAGGKIQVTPKTPDPATNGAPTEDATEEADSDTAETEAESTDGDTSTPAKDEPPSLQKLVADADRIEREKLKADLALQRAHSSRLAGALGYLKSKQDRPTSPERDASESAEDDDRSPLHARLSALERKTKTDAIARLVSDTISAAEPELVGIPQEDVQEASKAYAADYKAANECEDPQDAEEIAKAIVPAIRALALKLGNDRARAEAKRRSADPGASLKDRKRAAAIVQSSARAPSRPAPKPIDEMTDQEINSTLAGMRRRAGMAI